MAGSDEPRAYTPEQRDFVQEIYTGAEQAGVKIAGITTIQRVEDAEVGNIDAPVKIGQTGSVSVRVGQDGKLLPPRGFSDEAATSVLHIDVHADVVWDANGDAHVRYIAYAKQIDTATARYMEISRSGPSNAEWEQRMGGRPDHEAFDDPEFKDWVAGSMADTPAEAVRQALTPLVGGANQLASGRLEPAAAQPNQPVTPGAPPPTVPEPNQAGPAGGFPWWLTAVGIVVVVALAAGLGFWLFGGSDDDTASNDSADVVEAVDDDGSGSVDDQVEPDQADSIDVGAEGDDATDDGLQDDVAPGADEQAADSETDESSSDEPEAEQEPAKQEQAESSEAAEIDECATGTPVSGDVDGLDPQLALTGYQPFVDVATTELWILLCFAQPWTLGSPSELWSFAHLMIIELVSTGGQGFAAAPEGPFGAVIYEFHDGVWTIATETADGPVETTIMLTAGGNSLVRTALAVEPGFEGRLFIQTASTPSAADAVTRFEVDTTIADADAVTGNLAQLVEVVDVDSNAYPGIDPDGFGPATAPAPG